MTPRLHDRSSRLGVVVALLVLGLLAAGCAGGGTDPGAESGAASGRDRSPGPSASPAPPPPPDPVVGSCHALTVSEATDPVDPGETVSCGRAHTSVTVKVGQVDPVVDGHLLAVDSRTVRARIAASCPDDPGAFVGGSRTAQRLSRFEVVWFGPTLEQADAGASWYRCDLVAVRSGSALLPLPRRVAGVLDRPGALDRFGTCGTSAPDRAGFRRVACSERHTWRAVDVVDLPAGTRYLAKAATATGDAACKAVAAQRAGDDLTYSWSFEWPTRTQWTAGQRHGYCWLPRT